MVSSLVQTKNINMIAKILILFAVLAMATAAVSVRVGLPFGRVVGAGVGGISTFGGYPYYPSYYPAGYGYYPTNYLALYR